jgi:AraC family transcriptional regulator, regulatory protein of adaptative response / methylated-DNA-[protein]-cysteine methyltransferase
MIAEYGSRRADRHAKTQRSGIMISMPERRENDALRGAALRFAIGECSLGAILVAVTEAGIAAIMLGDKPDTVLGDFHRRFPEARASGDLAQTMARVIDFIEAPSRSLDLPLDMRGTEFKRQVWQALRAIPAGATASYRDIAGRIGAPQAARAVAQACASNPTAVAVPCHRVVRSDGTLAGYRWGVERKRRLLAREAA